MHTRRQTYTVVPTRLTWLSKFNDLDERLDGGSLTMIVVGGDHVGDTITLPVSREGIKQLWDELLTPEQQERRIAHGATSKRLDQIIPVEMSLPPRGPVAIEVDPARRFASLLRPVTPADPQPDTTFTGKLAPNVEPETAPAPTKTSAEATQLSFTGQPIALRWPKRDRTRLGQTATMVTKDVETGTTHNVPLRLTDIENLVRQHIPKTTFAELGIKQTDVLKVERDLPEQLDLQGLPPLQVDHVKPDPGRPGVTTLKAVEAQRPEPPVNKDWLSYMRGREEARQARDLTPPKRKGP
ncbi:MAG: hypothetical protein HRT64_03935 [Erythrobacter sp.]|nr:hypothetical protein [Erythrobacter sp.]